MLINAGVFKLQPRSFNCIKVSFRRKLSYIIITVSLLLFAQISSAHTSLPILSGSSDWEATLYGSPWTPVQGSYPNPFSAPVVTTSDPNDNGDRASLMWYKGSGIPDGRSGPDTVFFRYTLPYLLDEQTVQSTCCAWASFAADDWARLIVNGQYVATYSLDQHLLPNGQPQPIEETLLPFSIPATLIGVTLTLYSRVMGRV